MSWRLPTTVCAARSAGRVSRRWHCWRRAPNEPDALRALAQAFAARTPVVLLTSDGALYRDPEPYAGAFESLVGAQGAFRICGSAWRSCAPEPVGYRASTRPLIVVDGLDSWLEALVRQPDTENLLYDLLSQGAVTAAIRWCSPPR